MEHLRNIIERDEKICPHIAQFHMSSVPRDHDTPKKSFRRRSSSPRAQSVMNDRFSNRGSDESAASDRSCEGTGDTSEDFEKSSKKSEEVFLDVWDHKNTFFYFSLETSSQITTF